HPGTCPPEVRCLLVLGVGEPWVPVRITGLAGVHAHARERAAQRRVVVTAPEFTVRLVRLFHYLGGVGREGGPRVISVVRVVRGQGRQQVRQARPHGRLVETEEGLQYDVAVGQGDRRPVR